MDNLILSRSVLLTQVYNFIASNSGINFPVTVQRLSDYVEGATGRIGFWFEVLDILEKHNLVCFDADFGGYVVCDR